MSEGILRLVPKAATAHVRTRAQSALSLVLLVHLDVGGTCSFERSQSRTRMVCLAEAERWLGAGERALGVSLVGMAKWEFLGVVGVAFPAVDE
jgi:hypothetical protein